MILSKADQVYSFVASKIHDKDSYVYLRHGVEKHPGEVPEVWGYIFDGAQMDKDAEWTVYTALTLHALHQQSCEANQKGISFGKAVGKYAAKHGETILDKLRRIPEVRYLRDIVVLLGREDIGFDYPRFAKELYLVKRYDDADVKLSWGRDFYKGVDSNVC